MPLGNKPLRNLETNIVEGNRIDTGFGTELTLCELGFDIENSVYALASGK